MKNAKIPLLMSFVDAVADGKINTAGQNPEQKRPEKIPLKPKNKETTAQTEQKQSLYHDG